MEPRRPGGTEGGGGGGGGGGGRGGGEEDTERPPAAPEPSHDPQHRHDDDPQHRHDDDQQHRHDDDQQHHHDDDHSDQESPGPPPAPPAPPGAPPTLALDQVRLVSRCSNEYTDGPRLGAPEDRPPGTPPPAAPSPEGPPHPLLRCSSLQRLMGNDETIRTQPKRAELDGEERKPLRTPPGGGPNPNPNPHSERCAACGRCVCAACARRRALPSCWLCGRRCVCSAGGVAEALTCVCCVRGLFYHCSSDDEDTCSEEPFSCAPPRRAARWAAVGLLLLPLPCIACYPPARAAAAGLQRCYDAATRPGCRCQGGPRRRKGGGRGGKLT